jgi:2-polyprenyl-6-methoxyphenol hydroxylase-like FAD-dependent oxidoreductase
VKNERVLIVGGGIAGPALAIELSRRGFRPTVVERSAAPRDGGYKVDVRGVAIDVLDRMGVLEAARARDCGVREVAVIGEGLEEQAAFDANYFFAAARGTSRCSAATSASCSEMRARASRSSSGDTP